MRKVVVHPVSRGSLGVDELPEVSLELEQLDDKLLRLAVVLLEERNYKFWQTREQLIPWLLISLPLKMKMMNHNE